MYTPQFFTVPKSDCCLTATVHAPIVLKKINQHPTCLAPDLSEIRLLTETKRARIGHCTLPTGQISTAQKHRTITEFWYFSNGEGEFYLQSDNQSTMTKVHKGSCIGMPQGVSFQFRNTGTTPLEALMVNVPPWPGEQEAQAVGSIITASAAEVLPIGQFSMDDFQEPEFGGKWYPLFKQDELEMNILEVPCHVTPEAIAFTQTEGNCYVLEGSGDLYTRFYNKEKLAKLEEGMSFSFLPPMALQIRNHTEKPLRILFTRLPTLHGNSLEKINITQPYWNRHQVQTKFR